METMTSNLFRGGAAALLLISAASMTYADDDDRFDRSACRGLPSHAALESASETAVEEAVLPLPSLQVDPYRGMSPHFRVASARARALHAAATGTARLIVASAAALLPRVSPPERLLRASAAIKVGTENPPEDLAALLADAGFTPEDPVEEHGSFAV